MGKFIGHVVVTPEQAEDEDLADSVFEQLCALGAEEGEDEGWTPCECVGTIAQEQTSDIVREKFGNDRRRHEVFVAEHPQFAHVPYNGWMNHREPAYVAALSSYLQMIHDFRTRTYQEHPMRDQPEPGHKRCNGTGKIFVEGVVAREGLFSHASSIIHDRGRVADLTDPFALFFPDGKGLAAAIKDVPETWQSLGTTWEAATRAIVARFRASSYVELTFVV